MTTLNIPDGFDLIHIAGWGLAVREEDHGDRPSGTRLEAVSVESGVPLKQKQVDDAIIRVKQVIEKNKKEAIDWKENHKCECQ